MATTYTITLNGHTFERDEVPFRGPIEEFADQVWSEQDVLGGGSPGTILTFLGLRSQRWEMSCRADAATKDALKAVYDGRVAVPLITPQNTTGFNVVMMRFRVAHEEPSENGKFNCEFTLVAR